MKKFIFAIVLSVLIIQNCFVTVSAADDDFPCDDLAVLQLGSAAEGSTINYFFLRDIMCYRNTEGMYVSELFNGIVITEMEGVDTPEEAEGFITRLDKEGVFGAVDIAAGIFVEDGLYKSDKKYPVFIAFPNPSDYFNSVDETEGFCRYYIDTLCSVFAYDKFEYAYLAGVFFDDSYDSCHELRDFCIGLVKEKDMLTVATTCFDEAIGVDKLFASNKEDASRYNSTNSDGFVVYFDGVPSLDDPAYLIRLKEQAALLNDSKDACLLFVFDTFSTVYDCAAALEETVPNVNGRNSYEVLRHFVNRDYNRIDSISIKYNTADPVNNGAASDDLNEGRTATAAERAVFAILSVLALAAFGYILYALIYRGKKGE